MAKTSHLRGSVLLGENTYVHNRVGNIEGWGTSDGNVRTFAYDPNGRLLSATSSLPSVGNETFAYDRMGNWTPFDGRAHNAANELVEDTSHTYRYDADGNMVEKRSKVDASQVTTYGWDPLNRLIEVTTPTHTVRYRYDGVGRRIAKSVNGIETRYILDEQNVLEEKDASNVLTASNLHAGLDVLLMRKDYGTGATYWAYTDHLGSVEALTDAAGSVVERYGYSSFGQVTVRDASFGVLSSPPKTPFTYTAREWEVESGLFFHRARFMDPRLGRWLSRDPLGEKGGLNLYSYVGTIPTFWIDPLGLEVTVRSRNVSGLGGAGAHTWTQIEDARGSTTYSGIKNGDSLSIRRDYPADASPSAQNPETSRVIIPPPEGMTQEQWDRAVRESGERELLRDNQREYKLLGGDNGRRSGNCHVVTREVITGAGGRIPAQYDPPGANPGLHQ